MVRCDVRGRSRGSLSEPSGTHSGRLAFLFPHSERRPGNRAASRCGRKVPTTWLLSDYALGTSEYFGV